jgi:hypothetical protein
MVRLEKKIQLLHNPNCQQDIPSITCRPSIATLNIRDVEYRMHRSLSRARLLDLAFDIVFGHIGAGRRRAVPGYRRYRERAESGNSIAVRGRMVKMDSVIRFPGAEMDNYLSSRSIG